MALAQGARLGPYEIEEAIGAGGMGEVYRARDSRLERTVAIKVLPPHLAGDENARQRLAREAKAVSALTHPHICTLYDVGHEQGADFLVIEYLEGETLAERLENGPLSTEETLTFGTQIAAALDKAHRAGLIHRDLKPSNVMLTPAGAKLLDFGLAKSIAAVAPSDLTSPLTATTPLTKEGSIVGTFQYMAPEQLEGKEADARSDIFAFGTLLYEMAAGRRAFEGKTQASLIASILEREPPPITSLQPMSPPALDRLIQTCVAKDPEERRQSMHDVLLDLRWIREGGSQAGIATPVSRRRRTRMRLAWALASLLGLSTVALALVLGLTPENELPKIVSTVSPPAGTELRTFLGGHLALSADGSKLAMVARPPDGQFRIWVRALDAGEPRELEGTDNPYFPFWSPDGRSIAFLSDGKLKRVDAQGGAPLTLCDANGWGGAWSPDGTILFSALNRGPLMRVSEGGGEPVPVTTADADTIHAFPEFLPDGKHFVYVSVNRNDPDGGAVRLAELDGDLDRELIRIVSNVRFVNGHLIYSRQDTLMARPFDAGTLELAGDASILAEPVNRFTLRADFTVGGNLLAYVKRAAETGSQLTWFERGGGTTDQVTSETGLDDMALSPDERFIAVARDNPGSNEEFDIWTLDLERQVFTRVTFDGNSDDPIWSPDGRWIAYARGGDIYRKRANGAGQAELLLESEYDKVLQDWSPDGKTILFEHNGGADEHIWALPMTDDGPGEATAVLASPFREIHANLSPDGRWLAYASDETGTLQVYVMSWPDLEGKWPVTRDGGTMPRWRGDGGELYFMSPQREIVSVEVQPAADGFGIGEPRTLFQTRLDRAYSIRTHQFTASSDGSRFLVFERPSADSADPIDVTLVQHPLRDVRR